LTQQFQLQFDTALTANQDLRDQVTALDNANQALRDQVATLKTEASTLQADFASLRSDFSATIDAISPVNPLEALTAAMTQQFDDPSDGFCSLFAEGFLAALNGADLSQSTTLFAALFQDAMAKFLHHALPSLEDSLLQSLLPVLSDNLSACHDT
jgi:regulator of replication initiation timing